MVAEPAPGIYLVELFEWLTGSSHWQRLARIEDMADWTFYDYADWMQNTYEHRLNGRRDRNRGPDEP